MNLTISGNTMSLQGELQIDEVAEIYPRTVSWLNSVSARQVTIDLAELSHIDSSGVAFLDEIVYYAETKQISVNLVNVSENVQDSLQVYSSRELPEKPTKQRRAILQAVGDFAYKVGQNTKDLLYLISDSFYFAILNLFSRKGTRKSEFTNQCILIGMNAFPIVALISFLIGFILALQSAAQLRQFGASIYVADLVSISMTREMGPIMTAILFAGRSGSSIAAEIATMVVTEETDALNAMGLNPVRFNLVPKIHAITIMMPLLTILSMVLGIVGALVIGVSYLDIGLQPFYNQVVNALILRDILTGLVKSVVFAWLIVLTAAAYGFRVRGGAAEVGRATTSSVVTSIFLVILADSILGLIFYFNPNSPI